MSGAMILPVPALRLAAARPVLRFPAIVRQLGDPEPPAPAAPVLDINRQPLGYAADWQIAVMEEFRRHRALCRPLFDFLKDSGLLTRCLFLSSADADGPLLFRYIGTPTRLCLGDDWARANLNQPDSAPNDQLADGVAAQYVEAIDGGEPVYNRVFVTDVLADRPLVYTHMLMGWRLPDGRRSLLSCLELL